jgi:hypothetical protein
MLNVGHVKKQLFFLFRFMKKKEDRILLRYHLKKIGLEKPTRTRIVYCCNGEIIHGGLADRLKGIISFYAVALHCDVDFYIHHTHPFSLEDYWEPNEYEWRNESIRFNPFRDRIISDIVHKYKEGINPVNWIDTKNPRTYFVYSNANYLHAINGVYNIVLSFAIWRKYFDKLFKPSILLEKALNELPTGDYRVCHLRFVGILGDFADINPRRLSEEAVDQLFAFLDAKLNALHETKSDMPLYVLSDSPRFLAHISTNKRVRVLPGTPKHVDIQSKENSLEDHLKTFADFYFMARSQEVLVLAMPPLYESGFAKISALQHQVPYTLIRE